jgi:peptidoglycan/LPS O-acetylase OafA/YrhL
MQATRYNLAARLNEGNNFDLLRLFAASSVIFSHSFGLVTPGGHADADPLFRLTQGQMTFGELGVYIFFIASGFLITASLLRSRTLKSYFTKRLLRIIPGLAFVVFVSIILGAFLSALPASEYFRSATAYRYLINISMFFAQPSLPGVFTDNPLPDVVNGSLWTLKFEFFCYVMLAVLSRLNMLTPVTVVVGAVVCILAGVFYNGPGYGYLFYSSFFLAGASLFLWQKHVLINRKLLVGAIVLLVGSCLTGCLKAGFVVAGAYCVIYAAFSSDLGERFRQRFGDYSYGIYLFGFPIQQTVASFLGHHNVWWKEFLIAYPLTLVFAVISWKLVEQPSMELRARLQRVQPDAEIVAG